MTTHLPIRRNDIVFQLPDEFILSYASREPAWGPVGYVTYKRTYARDLESTPQRIRDLASGVGVSGSEEWWLTVARVVEGCYQIQEWWCTRNARPWNPIKAERSAREMYDAIFNFRFLPPGRGLWMMGADYIFEHGSAALQNCGFVTTAYVAEDLARPFTWIMDMLMLGVGCGYDTRGAGRVLIQAPKVSDTTYSVSDDRDGWVGLLRAHIAPYAGLGALPKDIDVSAVRLYGSPIRGFGGTASGPQPLLEMVSAIRGILDARIGDALTSADIVDIAGQIGRCVVAGNVRRSALICLGDREDAEFLALKDRSELDAMRAELAELESEARNEPRVEAAIDDLRRRIEEHPLEHHRWSANHSIGATVGMNYDTHAEQTATNGEPAYLWLDNARSRGRFADPVNNVDSGVMGVNPCGEQFLHSRLTGIVSKTTGLPELGGELCCLSESFPANHSSYASYARTLKLAYLYAKTVTLLPTHDPATNEIMDTNRRIGLSMAGAVQAMNRVGRAEFFKWCDTGYRYVEDIDAIYSDWLGIPRSIKKTTIKPGGTTPLLSGATPGIHFPEAEYYWRVIRFATDSPWVSSLRDAGYVTHDLNPGEPNTTAIYFPVKEPWFCRGKDDVTMWEQLELAAQMQYYWSDNGVSCTVEFDPATEADDIPRALELYDRRLKGISFLPRIGHGYKHAPYQPIDADTYAAAVAKLRPIVGIAPTSHENTERFCDGDTCTI